MPDPTPLSGAVQFFVHGGFFMLLLVLLSIATLAVIIWRGIALRYEVILPAELQSAIDALRPHGSMETIERMASKGGTPLAAVVRTLIDHRSWRVDEAREAIQTRARHEVARMEKGLVILEIVTGIAPLLGLLGTLSGLVGVFANLGSTGDPTLVARGISEALNTTIVGLAVAAPSIIAFNYYSRKIEIMAVEMESTVADLLEKIYSNRH